MIWFLAFPTIILISVSTIFTGWYYSVGFMFWQKSHWLQLYGNFYATFHGQNSEPIPPLMILSTSAGMITFMALLILFIQLEKRLKAKTVHGGFDQKSLHGTARFAKLKDVTKSGLLAASGVVLGKFQNKRLTHDGPEHVLVFAPTRSGKGVSVVVPTLLEWKHSSVVLDIKCDLFKLSSGYRQQMGQRILRFDPTHEVCSKFNPLCEVRIGSSEAISDVQRLANILVDPNGQKGEKYFAQEGYDWLSAVILHVLIRAKKHKKDTPSFADVATFMSGKEFAVYDDGNDGMFKALCQSMMEFDHGDEAIDNVVHNKASYMRSMADKQRSGVISMAILPMQVFQDPLVSKNTSSSDFTIDELMELDTPSTLYLMIPANDIPRLKPLIKMLFEIIIMKRAGRMERKPNQRLLLLMDEFTSLGKLEIFETAIAYIAGYGMKFVGVIQDFNQLHSTYGKEESIFSNCHVRYAFAPNRYETAKALSDMTGKTTVIQMKRSTSGGGINKSVSDSSTETARNLMSPDEVMSMRGIEKGDAPKGAKDRAGQALIFVAGLPVIKAEQLLFYQDNELRRRTELPPASISHNLATKAA